MNKILATILALSLLGNGVLTWVYLGQRDKTTEAVTIEHQAVGAATACSDGTQKLSDQAAKRQAAGAAPIAAAKASAAAGAKRADAILSTPAAVAGNDCLSARMRIDTWWQGMGKP